MLRFLRIERPTTDDLPPALHGDVRRLLHAVDVRRERRDEDLPVAQREDRAERLAHEPLGAGVPGPFGVRRVAEEQVDSAIADLREPADVRLEAVDRRVVELPVPRVDDAPRVGLDHERRPSRGSSGRRGRARGETGRARAVRRRAPPRRARTSVPARARRVSTSRARASAASRRPNRRRPPAGDTADHPRDPRGRA